MKKMSPQEIEIESFRMIDAEAGPHDHLTEAQWQIVRRMIHATADFDFINTVRFHAEATTAGCRALHSGAAIYADTEMLAAAIGKGAQDGFGCEVFCLVADDAVKKESLATGETRSAIAMRKAAPRLDGGIIAIGNAPTALHEALTLCAQGKLKPALILGLPVGFVEARESKERLWASGLVCITNIDRKGGTPATAAALNALLKLSAQWRLTLSR
jgi:precorrin-8X/cobalt-precorrin-8 methylmutase